jgi:hypothetical protein
MIILFLPHTISMEAPSILYVYWNQNPYIKLYIQCLCQKKIASPSYNGSLTSEPLHAKAHTLRWSRSHTG